VWVSWGFTVQIMVRDCKFGWVVGFAMQVVVRDMSRY
jgi:hypothetical protein